jgi:hypothetical protein
MRKALFGLTISESSISGQLVQGLRPTILAAESGIEECYLICDRDETERGKYRK